MFKPIKNTRRVWRNWCWLIHIYKSKSSHNPGVHNFNTEYGLRKLQCAEPRLLHYSASSTALITVGNSGWNTGTEIIEMSVTGIGNKTHVKYSFSCSDDAKLLGESNDSKWKVTEFRTVKAYCGNLSHSADSFLAIPKQFFFCPTTLYNYPTDTFWYGTRQVNELDTNKHKVCYRSQEWAWFCKYAGTPEDNCRASKEMGRQWWVSKVDMVFFKDTHSSGTNEKNTIRTTSIWTEYLSNASQTVIV